MKQMEKKEINKPVFNKRIGGLSISAFENEQGMSWQLQKSWPTKDGSYEKRSLNLFKSDLYSAKVLLEQAIKEEFEIV